MQKRLAPGTLVKAVQAALKEHNGPASMKTIYLLVSKKVPRCSIKGIYGALDRLGDKVEKGSAQGHKTWAWANGARPVPAAQVDYGPLESNGDQEPAQGPTVDPAPAEAAQEPAPAAGTLADEIRAWIQHTTMILHTIEGLERDRDAAIELAEMAEGRARQAEARLARARTAIDEEL